MPRKRVLKWCAMAVVVPAAFLAGLAAAPSGTPSGSGLPSVAQIAQERFEVADRAYQQVQKAYQAGLVSELDTYGWLRRRAIARRKMPQSDAERVVFLEQYVQQLQHYEQATGNRIKSGSASTMDLYTAQYLRLEGEYWLAKAREK